MRSGVVSAPSSIMRWSRIALVLALVGCAADAREPPSEVDGRVLDAEEGSLHASFLIEQPIKGWNPMHVELFDGDDAPLAGAEIAISPWMPAHGHGSEDTTAKEHEPGVYETDDVLFIMAGHWELHVEVKSGKSTNHFVVPVNVAED